MIRVDGECPHCGHRALELLDHRVVCSREQCVDPWAASNLLHAFAYPRQVEQLPLGDVAA